MVAGLDGALVALLGGPAPDSSLSTAIPAGTALRSASVGADGTATVDLSGRFDDGGGTLSMTHRLGQVAMTALDWPGVERLELRLDGALLEVLGGEGLLVDQPLTVDDVPDKALVLVDTPRPGDLVTSPVRVTGRASVSGMPVALRVVTSLGRMVYEGTARVDGPASDEQGNRIWSPFEATIEFDPGEMRTGWVVALEFSAEDAGPTDVMAVPVRFTADAPVPTVMTVPDVRCGAC